jgi:hypothetical protein
MTCHRIECVETEKALKEALNSFRIRTAQTAELNVLRRDLEHQLAESQAREQVLRDALQFYADNATFCGNTSERALAAPADDSALREWGVTLLEEIRDAATSDYDYPELLDAKIRKLRSGK